MPDVKVQKNFKYTQLKLSLYSANALENTDININNYFEDCSAGEKPHDFLGGGLLLFLLLVCCFVFVSPNLFYMWRKLYASCIVYKKNFTEPQPQTASQGYIYPERYWLHLYRLLNSANVSKQNILRSFQVWVQSFRFEVPWIDPSL